MNDDCVLREEYETDVGSLEEEQTNGFKRKYISESEQNNCKKQKQEEETVPVCNRMAILLGNQPDEVVKEILNYLPSECTISVSSVSKQFRRVWKNTPYGIVYNMLIKLNHSFKVNSYSLADKAIVGEFAKNAVTLVFGKVEKEIEFVFNSKKTGIFKAELSKIDQQSENFSNAIPKITRFDYDEGDNIGLYAYKGHCFEIEFGELGMVRFSTWTQLYLKHSNDGINAELSITLKELKLTNDEWDIIIEKAISYMDPEVSFREFSFTNKPLTSQFTNHKLDFEKFIW
ncbi:FBOX domain-containing protein [Naegleria gruberi]|uniref:FBOX domain-containing protein n=1 Tax=Naegleria gruberi TaxID=5762 RepID=D2VU47_NAEGR|nr:FBOX domain-containing protein [Naegleria gruberi]EFC39625.1 FBOX domain-containing protein [Naegleria gruberi]|eukprot:XP_002672369.1 FBOX domain-containing protein [Naegleria gruberi strain NEG-M]